MFNYSIKYFDNEKIIYLYVDFNYEFGIDFNIKNIYSSMKKEIKNYLKKNKLLNNGEKIALVFGGIVLAVLLVVEEPMIIDNFDLIYVTDSIIPKTEMMEEIKKEEIINKEVIEKENKIEMVAEKKDESVKEEKVEKKIINEVKVMEEPKIEEKEDNNIYVMVYRSDGSILNLELDEYLIGVVGAEMPASFGIEALKVQAIISRTYALKSLKIGRRLTDTVSTQVYNDINQLKSRWGSDFDKYYNKIKEAVYTTKDISIYYDNELIDAVFFATSNGKTEDSKYVWGNSIPYLVSVDSSIDKETTPYLRTVNKDLDEVLNILGVDNSDYSINSYDESGRVLEITFGNKTFSGVEFRNLLGLRSSDFDLEILNNTINITTRGYGHGVGLSQYGAGKMAEKGYNYKDIIKHYYTGVVVK